MLMLLIIASYYFSRDSYIGAKGPFHNKSNGEDYNDNMTVIWDYLMLVVDDDNDIHSVVSPSLNIQSSNNRIYHVLIYFPFF